MSQLGCSDWADGTPAARSRDVEYASFWVVHHWEGGRRRESCLSLCFLFPSEADSTSTSLKYKVRFKYFCKRVKCCWSIIRCFQTGITCRKSIFLCEDGSSAFQWEVVVSSICISTWLILLSYPRLVCVPLVIWERIRETKISKAKRWQVSDFGTSCRTQIKGCLLRTYLISFHCLEVLACTQLYSENHFHI